MMTVIVHRPIARRFRAGGGAGGIVRRVGAAARAGDQRSGRRRLRSANALLRRARRAGHGRRSRPYGNSREPADPAAASVSRAVRARHHRPSARPMTKRIPNAHCSAPAIARQRLSSAPLRSPRFAQQKKRERQGHQRNPCDDDDRSEGQQDRQAAISNLPKRSPNRTASVRLLLARSLATSRRLLIASSTTAETSDRESGDQRPRVERQRLHVVRAADRDRARRKPSRRARRGRGRRAARVRRCTRTRRRSR